MRDLTEEVVGILVRPRRLYGVFLVVGSALLGLLWIAGVLPSGDLLEAMAALVLFPPFVHWMGKRIRGMDAWRPTTLDKKVEKVAWRLGVGESARREGGLHTYAGAYLDAPDALETYLPPSFERAGGDEGWELWVSAELRAWVRREGLEVTVTHWEEEDAFRRALPPGAGGGALPPEGGP